MSFFERIKRKLWKVFFKNARLSYSQGGEDLILNTIFNKTQKGFYVDIGANNPHIQSNTHFFYMKGWHGINIDALPGSMKIFNRKRNRDINIEAAISNKNDELTYYMFKKSFYNTFNKHEIEKLKKITEFVGEKIVRPLTLASILDDFCPGNIDFLTVDVEGYDLEVLESNNWKKYRPKIIVTEFFSSDLKMLEQNKIFQFLNNKGYRFLCNSLTNAFYIENDFFTIRFTN